MGERPAGSENADARVRGVMQFEAPSGHGTHRVHHDLPVRLAEVEHHQVIPPTSIVSPFFNCFAAVTTFLDRPSTYGTRFQTATFRSRSDHDAYPVTADSRCRHRKEHSCAERAILDGSRLRQRSVSASSSV